MPSKQHASDSVSVAHNQTSTRHAGRPSITHWLALLLVVLILTPMAIWPALDTFRPVARVHVARALPAIAPANVSNASTEQADRPAPQTRTVQAPGWIEPDPYHTAVIALADGVVESIHVLEGQSVHKGQVLAELVSEDAELALRQAEAMVSTMEANLAKARAEHTAATTDWEQPVQRDREVATTAAALVEAQSELKRLPAEIKAVEADLRRWREEQQRVQQAYDKGAATTRERLVADYELASTQADLEALTLRKGVLEARVERLEAESNAAVRAAELRVAERLTLSSAAATVSDAQASLENARAQRDEARLRLDRMTIVSPIDGNVLHRLKVPGDKVMLGMDDPHSSHIVHLYDPQQLQVRVDVPLADAAQVRVGQACEVVVDVLPDTVFAGEVTRIIHKADLQKNTLQVKVRVINPAEILKPEMLTRVRFIGDSPGYSTSQQTPGTATSNKPIEGVGQALNTNRVRVPADCIDGSRVWVVRSRRGLSGHVSAVSIEALEQENGFVTVEGPLSVGDLVVQQPTGLTPDERVKMTLSEGGVV